MKQLLIHFLVIAMFVCSLEAAFADSGTAGTEPGFQVQSQGDIQWFKDEMRISSRYVEDQEGILGMSWLHFLLMLFLVLFFIGALVAYYRQTSRTKRILQKLLREED